MTLTRDLFFTTEASCRVRIVYDHPARLRFQPGEDVAVLQQLLVDIDPLSRISETYWGIGVERRPRSKRKFAISHEVCLRSAYVRSCRRRRGRVSNVLKKS